MNYEKALKRKYDLLKRLFFPVTCMCALLQYLFNNASLPFSALFWSVNYDKAARGLVISRGTVKSALSVTLQHVSIRIRKDDDKSKVWGSQRKPEDGPTLWWGRNLERMSPPLFHKVFRWFFNHETESESFNNCCLLSVVNLSTGENLQEIKYFLFLSPRVDFLIMQDVKHLTGIPALTSSLVCFSYRQWCYLFMLFTDIWFVWEGRINCPPFLHLHSSQTNNRYLKPWADGYELIHKRSYYISMYQMLDI